MTDFPKTDPKMRIEEIPLALEATKDRRKGYFNGLLRGRGDPGLRAVYLRYDDETKRIALRQFSYDELVVTAYLVHIGADPRTAAAIAHQEYAVAGECNKTIKVRPDREYVQCDTLSFPTGIDWTVALAKLPESYLYVDDYMVWAAASEPEVALNKDQFTSEAFFACNSRKGALTEGPEVAASPPFILNATGLPMPSVTYRAFDINWVNPANKPAEVCIPVPLSLKADIFMDTPGAEQRLGDFVDEYLTNRFGETPSYASECLDDVPLIIVEDDDGNPTGFGTFV